MNKRGRKNWMGLWNVTAVGERDSQNNSSFPKDRDFKAGQKFIKLIVKERKVYKGKLLFTWNIVIHMSETKLW